MINMCNKFILCKKFEKEVEVKLNSIILAENKKQEKYIVESWAEDCTLKLNVGDELVFNKRNCSLCS